MFCPRLSLCVHRGARSVPTNQTFHDRLPLIASLTLAVTVSILGIFAQSAPLPVTQRSGELLRQAAGARFNIKAGRLYSCTDVVGVGEGVG